MRNSETGVEHWAQRRLPRDQAPGTPRLQLRLGGAARLPGHDTLVTITFDDRDGKTEMTFHQAIFETVEDRVGHEGGWRETFDDLTTYLKEIR